MLYIAVVQHRYDLTKFESNEANQVTELFANIEMLNKKLSAFLRYNSLIFNYLIIISSYYSAMKSEIAAKCDEKVPLAEHESALFAAARQGNVEKVMAQLEVSDTELFAKYGPQNKTPLQIAEEQKHTDVICLLKAKMIFNELSKLMNVGFILADPLVAAPWLGKPITDHRKNKRAFPTYTHYLKTQCKLPSYEHLCNYLFEIQVLLQNPESQNGYIAAREIWTEVVATFKAVNRQWLARYGYKNAIIERIRPLIRCGDLEKVYNDCLAFIQTNSSLVVTFNAGVLKNGLHHYQLLNVFEKKHRGPYYMARRENTERGLFECLDEKLKEKFLNNLHARPHYAALILHDAAHIAPIDAYGKSYVVFRDIVKACSLFVPADSMLYRENRGLSARACGLRQMEILLWQASDLFLAALVHRVTHGFFPDYYTQQIGCILCCSYLEALLPPVNFLNPLFVEHIHIDEREYKLTAEEKTVLDDTGLNITNGVLNPYAEFKKQLLQVTENKDYKQSKALLNDHPSLISVTNHKGYSLLHIALQLAANSLVQLFLACGFNPNTLTIDNQNSLTLAVEFGPRAMVQMIMMTLTVKTINHKNAKGESALFVAAQKGYLMTVTLLLAIPGIDAEAKCGEKTALQAATEKGYFRVAKSLRIFMSKSSVKKIDGKAAPQSAAAPRRDRKKIF